MTTSSRQTPALALGDLRSHVDGRVIGPDDDEYDAVRRVAAGGTDPRPAVVIRPAGEDDVGVALRFAQDAGLAVAVRSGGHSGAAHGTVDGGVVVDLRDLTSVDIDPDARTVWAGAGLTAGALTATTVPHGLAVGFGDTGSVGISGITLGGGVGYLSRRHGLTIDNLLAADVVTADGRVLRADADHHADLFWALRGGGGNVGVVTRLLLRLHDVRQVVGGILVLPATAATLAGFVAASDAAPRALTTIANVMPCPPFPFVAPEVHGTLVIMGLVCFTGDPDAGAAALAPFRSLAEPIADLVRPTSYLDLFPPEDPEHHPTAVARTGFAEQVDEAAATTIVERLAVDDAAMRVVQLRVLGGAVADVAPLATAYAHRSSRIMVNVAAFVDGEADRTRRTQWVEELARELTGTSTAAYVNFLGDEGPDRVRAAYPGATWDRLAAVKATYDPTNVFRRNQNVPPAEGSTG